MAEGDGSSAGIASVDSSDVFNPKQTCRNCGTQNDIAITICKACGLDVYGTDQNTLDEDAAAMLNNKNKSHQKSSSNPFFDKTIAAPAPTPSAELIEVHTEGMMEIEHIEDFLRDNIDEGRKDRNNNNNNNQQNINGNHNNISGNRPLFTTILVIYWLYYLVWFVVGVVFTFVGWFVFFNKTITVICMMVPSLIMLILMSRISCLNSVNINNINHYENLNENAKQKYKLMSILITILLMFAALLRAIWWIYCIVEYIGNNQTTSTRMTRLSVTLLSLLVNEFGTVVLINLDYLIISYFERNQSKQGLFGIINNPYPCLISLSILVSIQLWILSYGSFEYQPDAQICSWWIAYIFECGLHVVYIIAAIITILIPILYGMKIYQTSKNNENNNTFHKLSTIEQYTVLVICIMLMLLTFIMALSIFAGFQEAYTWIHLLLLPQLFGIMFALFKLRKLSQT